MCPTSNDTPAVRSASESLRVCVVIPARDEETHVAETVTGIPAWVDTVIVVDDGSEDDTAGVLERLGAPRTTIVRHSRNLGFGAAMTSGYRAALESGCDIVVKMDADGQMSPADLESIVSPIAWGLADFVKGNRFHAWRQMVGMPAQRRIGNLTASLISKAPTGYWHSFDPHCGYTAIESSALRRMDLDAMSRDYRFQVEQLFVLRAIDARVVDVPVQAVYADEISGLRFGDGARYPFELVKGWATRRRLAAGALPRASEGGLLDTLSDNAAGVGEPGWWRRPGMVVAGMFSLATAVFLLVAGIAVLVLDRTVAQSRTPGSLEAREVAERLRRRGR